MPWCSVRSGVKIQERMVAAVPTTQPQMEDPQSVTTSPLSQPAVRQVNTADGTVTQVRGHSIRTSAGRGGVGV